MYWRKLTTRGAVIGGALGLLTALVLVFIGPTVWVDTFGFAKAIFPYKYPAIFSVSVAFIGIWIFSLFDNSANAKAEQAAFDAQFLRSQTGIGASEASNH